MGVVRILYILCFITATTILNSYAQEIEYKYRGATPTVKEPKEIIVGDIDEPLEPHWGSTQIDRFEIPELPEPLEEEPFEYLDGFYDDHIMGIEPPEISADMRRHDDGCPVGTYCGDDYESILIEPPHVPGELYIIIPVEECPIGVKCN